MSRLFWVNDEQWSKIEPLLPHYGSPPRVDVRRILSGIVHVLRRGCRWCGCPAEYGPCTTVYNRFNRWFRKGIYAALTGDKRTLPTTSRRQHSHQGASLGGRRRKRGE